MFCTNCGAKVSDTAQFCSSCGHKLMADATATTVTPHIASAVQKKNKGGKKIGLIFLFVFLGLALLAIAINLVEIYIVNSASKLEDKLMSKVWYSEPTEAVAVDDGDNIMSAYSVEFHDDGTATISAYLGSCPAYEEMTPEDMEIVKTETVDWEISSNRTLEFDGVDYSCKTLFGDKEDRWYIEDGKLHINRTYYSRDKWGYAEEK